MGNNTSCHPFPFCCRRPEVDYFDNHFYQKRIKNDRIEHELAYAREQSNIPKSLHGVFWMDMFYESSVAKDPSYENKPWFIKDFEKLIPKLAPADVFTDLETLICFGDMPATWVPEQRTLKNAGYCGDKGHWTFPNTLQGAIGAQQAIFTRMDADLVFENDEMTEIYVASRLRDPITGMWIQPPRTRFEMLMLKKDWGWDRRTTAGNLPDAIDHNDVLLKLLPQTMMNMLQSGENSNVWNYPMVQIVDGHGKRTKYYDEYLQFMKRWGTDEQIVIARSDRSTRCCL